MVSQEEIWWCGECGSVFVLPPELVESGKLACLVCKEMNHWHLLLEDSIDHEEGEEGEEEDGGMMFG